MTLSASDREFVAVGAAVAAGCHPCTHYHTLAALKAGLSAEQVRQAIDQAQEVRAGGGVAVGNVGRHVLGIEAQPLGVEESPCCRGSALVRIGAAAGCNSGVLLGAYARQAAELGVDSAELREAIEVAEMVKTRAAEFFRKEAERFVARASEPAVAVSSSASCCPPA